LHFLYTVLYLSTYMSKIQVEVSKAGTESGASLLRRFQRKVQDSEIVKKVRGKRYNERPKSKLTNKKNKLKRNKKGVEIEKLKKLGKIKPRIVRGAKKSF